MQHCWLQYITDPHYPPVFPVSDFLFKYGEGGKKNIGGALKLLNFIQ